MLTKIKLWITELSTFVKAVLVFVPIIIGVAKLITIHDRNILKESKLQAEQVSNTTLLITVAAQVDSINSQLTKHIKDQVISSSEVYNKLIEVTGKQDKLKSLVTTEFAKTMTPKQVLEMMNYFDEKKNYNIIQPDTGNYRIPYFKIISRK
jgi:cell division protein YceG involved in septum cleavage